MVHQAKEEWQVATLHALLIQRQDEIAALGMNKVVGVLDPFGDALERKQRADIIACQKIGKLLSGDIGIDSHPLLQRSQSAAKPPSHC
jgi:hypothetical protein